MSNLDAQAMKCEHPMTIAELHAAVRKYPGCPKCEHVITLSGYCVQSTCSWVSPEYKRFVKENYGKAWPG